MIRAVILAMALLPGSALAAACAPDVAQLIGPDSRQASIRVEIADTPDSRARGLMGRKSLGPKAGMLFVYDSPRPASFWMKNTLIPLDMLFFDAAGTLRHVHPKARPLDLTPISGAAPGDPDPDRLLVLELAGGEAARLGLVPGIALRHPAVPQAGAAAPCP